MPDGTALFVKKMIFLRYRQHLAVYAVSLPLKICKNAHQDIKTVGSWMNKKMLDFSNFLMFRSK